MTERERFQANEVFWKLYQANGGRCEVCGCRLTPDNNAQLAHRIPKGQVKKYSKKIIHHPLNLAIVCSIKCNSAVLVNSAEEFNLVQKITLELQEVY